MKTRNDSPYLDRPPSGDVKAPRAVLRRHSPTKRDKPLHLKRLDAVRKATRLLLGLGRTIIIRPVYVDFRDGSFETSLRISREAHAEIIYGSSGKRLALLEERRV
jgi:hypothetical protein